MKHWIALVGGLGLWAAPAAAQELRLEPPTLSAQAERCGAAERALCPTLDERGMQPQSLACDACKEPMPPELTASPHAVPSSKSNVSPECLPGASRPAPASCFEAPRLDIIPRP